MSVKTDRDRNDRAIHAPRSPSRLSWRMDVGQAPRWIGWGVTLFVTPPPPCSARDSGQRRRCGQTPPVCELEKIVGGADNGPLGAHFFDAAQQKLAESACLLDLPEHRLGQLFASPIGAGMAASFDLLAHSLDAGQCSG